MTANKKPPKGLGRWLSELVVAVVNRAFLVVVPVSKEIGAVHFGFRHPRSSTQFAVLATGCGFAFRSHGASGGGIVTLGVDPSKRAVCGFIGFLLFSLIFGLIHEASVKNFIASVCQYINFFVHHVFLSVCRYDNLSVRLLSRVNKKLVCGSFA
jgi:hypothetical protein